MTNEERKSSHILVAIDGDTTDEQAADLIGEIQSKLETESFEDLARQYNVRSVPTVVIEQNGSEVNRLIGATTKRVILENLS